MLLTVVEIGLSLMFGSCIVALIAAQFLRVGTDADEIEAKLMKGSE